MSCRGDFGQLKDPHVVSFSPMHHWTEHNIRMPTETTETQDRLTETFNLTKWGPTS